MVPAMPKIHPFENYSDDYDAWFTNNQLMYQHEIEAIRNLLPLHSFGLEIGVGSGKFSVPFGIQIGIDPSYHMLLKSKKMGINAVMGIAESLPFKNNIFDFALVVTSICFFDNVKDAFNEAHRVLKNHGSLIIGFVDSESYLGKKYFLKRNESKFYKEATFYSTDTVMHYLKETGFDNFECNQTIFRDGESSALSFKKGYGEGSFIVIKAIKRSGS